MSRTSLPVQLQHDTGKFWCIIIFTRSCKMLPFEHDLVQKVKRSDKGQHRTHPRFWCGEYLCKITKWYWQFLQSYRVHKAAWPWASLKVQNGHTKVNVELVRDFYVENIHIKLEHHTGNLRRVITFTRSSQIQREQRPKPLQRTLTKRLAELSMFQEKPLRRVPTLQHWQKSLLFPDLFQDPNNIFPYPLVGMCW